MNMSGRTLIIALSITVFLVFVFPYFLGPFALNGTELLILVAILWGSIWGVTFMRSKRRLQKNSN